MGSPYLPALEFGPKPVCLIQGNGGFTPLSPLLLLLSEAGKSPLRRVLETSPCHAPLSPSQPASVGDNPAAPFSQTLRFGRSVILFLPPILGVRFTNAPWQHRLSVCFPLAHGTELGEVSCKMVCQHRSFSICSETCQVLHTTTSSVVRTHSSQFRSELGSVIPSSTVFCP